MAKKRKVKRTFIKILMLWIGRLLLGRVHRHSLKSVAATSHHSRAARSLRIRRRPSGSTAAVRPARRRRAGRGFLIAAFSAAAMAALKVGVEHVIEAERGHEVVTPDFDVFADDEE